MTVIVCTGARGGMLFLGRRVSRDREIIADIASLKGRLLCHPFSEKYLRTTPLTFTVSDRLLEEAAPQDLCFVEHLPLRPHLKEIDRLIIYNFGEAYPYDLSLDIDPRAEGFHLAEACEIVGHSHKIITKEVYER